MKNVMAVISGIIFSLTLFALVTALVMKFNIEPYASFSTGKFSNTDLGILQNKILVVNYFVVFPFIGLITGCIVGLISRNKEYILGIISITPIGIAFIDRSVSWVLSIIELVILCLLGVLFSKRLKNRRAKTS